MLAISGAVASELPGDTDAAIRQLYACHAQDLHRYVERFCPDLASADDIVQETFIRAWRHLPQLSSRDYSVRPWLFRVARNLLIDADRAARSRPITVPAQAAEEGKDDTGLNRVLDQQIMADALHQLSHAHRTVLVETYYGGRTLGRVARQLGIPDGTARSRRSHRRPRDLGGRGCPRHRRPYRATRAWTSPAVWVQPLPLTSSPLHRPGPGPARGWGLGLGGLLP